MALNSLTKPSMIRLGAFAAVFLLSAGLLVTLFDEARAAEIQVENIGTVSGGSATIDVDIIVPEDQRMPLEKISAAIETRTPGEETKTSSSDVSLVTISSCNSIISGCDAAGITVEEGDSGILTAVEFIGAKAGSAPISDGYFGTGVLDWTHDGGYGYDPVAGYGYGIMTPGQSVNEGNDFGYGYTGADLTLSFRFTISPNALGTGSYWFTALAITGSGLTGALNSPAKPFAVSTAGGGGGTGTGPTTVTAGSTQTPAGATGAWSATGQTHSADTTIIIQTGSDTFPKVEFTLENDVNNAEITVVVWPADQPPEGVTPPPWANTQTGYFVQITIDDESTGNPITIFVEIDASVVDGNSGKAFAAKHTNPWNTIGKIDLEFDEDNNVYTGSFQTTCCSTFLVGFDDEDPTVSLSADTSLADEGDTVMFTADADDNVEVDRVEFYLGDDLMHTATSAPFTWDWTASGIGEHTIEARAYDIVGNSANDDTSVQVQERTTPGVEECPHDPSIPADHPDCEETDDVPALPVVLLVATLALIAGAMRNHRRNGGHGGNGPN